MRIIILTTAMLILAINAAADPKESVSQRTIAAEAIKSPINGKLDKQRFKYREIELVLRDDGGWTMEGLVSHNRLLCSTYEVGLRFGIGQTACVDVNWLSDTRYVTSHTQCNSATMSHRATGLLDNPGDFEKISCAQISVKCSGRCD